MSFFNFLMVLFFLGSRQRKIRYELSNLADFKLIVNN